MYKLYLLAFVLIFGAFNSVLAQTDGVQIDYSTTPPARSNSAVFELNSTNQGLLVPRLTTVQRTAIATPANGLLVFDITLSRLYFYDAAVPAWIPVGTGSGSVTSVTASNGLNSTGGTTPDIKLGGTLTGPTTVGQGANDLVFNLNGTGDFAVQDNGVSVFQVRDDGSIGVNNASPNASAILDIVSTNKGILIPRMTYTQQQAISSPANGLLVFNTTSNCLDIYTSGAWQSIYCSCPILAPLNAITGATTVCSGTNQTYTVPAIMGASNYTWTVTGVLAGNITGNGGSSISFNAPSTNAYTVSVTASNACNTSAVSQSLVVNAYTAVPPTPVWSPAPTNVCAGGNYNYTIQNGLGVNGTSAITYTWTVTATGGATATLTANSQTAAAGSPVTYTAAASGITLTHGSGLGALTISVVGNNTCGTTATPLSFVQNIVGQPTVSASPLASQSVCTGAAITLTSGAVSGTGNYTYQWYFNSTNSTSGATAIAGATGTIASGVATTNYVLSTVNGSGASPAGTGFPGTYYYYCSFTPLNSTNCGPVASGFAQVIVVAQPTVTTQPTASQTVCTGGGVTLTSGPSGIGNYTYQWFYNTTNSNSGGTAIAGATGTLASGATTNYTLVTNNAGTASPAGTGVSGMFYYYCRFTPLANTNCGPISSNVATVDVKGQPTFTTQPAASQTVCTAASVNVSAAVSGTGNYTFQWYYNSSNSNSGGTAISGATGTVASGSASNYTLLTTNVSAAAPAGTGVGGTFYYYCVFSPQGTTNCGPVTSSVATVIVNTRSADPTLASASLTTICNGGSTSLTLTGGGGGTGQVIRWYAGSCGGALAGTGNGLSVSPTVTTTYFGRYETPAPCSHNSACQSVTVTVNQPSVAATALAASVATICTGSSTTLTQSGGSLGTGAVWRWYSNSGYTTLVGTGTGANASLTVAPTTTTTYWLRIEGTTAPCTAILNGPVGGVTVTVDQTSVLGTISNAGPIDFCNSSGNWSATPISVSGNVGTINWQYGWSNGAGGTAGGGFEFWSPTGASPGYCCFPKKVAVSDGNPDRVRWTVTNGVCPTTAASAAILLRNRYNEDPTSLASNQNNYCTGTVANITLTATFPAGTAILGNVQFYSGSCGGTLVATVAGNGSTTVATTITAPTATTTYYVRYNPGTGAGCAAGNCVSTTVNVSQLSVAGTVTQAAASGSTVCAGTNVSYTLAGHSGTFNYFEYQWNTTAGAYSGSWGTTNPYNWTSGTNGASILYVRAAVTNGSCPTVYTAPVNVTVNAVAVAGTVTQSPASGSTVCQGTPVTYTNTGITGTFQYYEYQWNSTSGAYSGSWIGTNPGTWTSSPNGPSVLYVRSVVTSGVCPTAYSAPVNVTVNATPVAGSITQSPVSGGTVCNGANVTYTLGGHSGTFTTYKYQWNASGGVPGSYSNLYATNPATWPSSQNGASVLHVIAEVTNGVCPAVYTAPVNVTVLSTANNGGTIAAPTTICAGDAASISNVTAATTGTPASAGPTYYYYWERTTAPVVGWTLYETTAALTSALPTAVTGTPGTYNLVRNSAFGCAGQVNSNVLTLTVNGAPAAPTSVTASPSTITQGSGTNLNATASGNINWYTTPSGVTPIGTSASGVNFPISPAVTTTYYAGTSGGSSGSQTFSYSGSIVNWTVPVGVTSVDIETWGAQGGNGNGGAGGLGARMKGTFTVTPGQVLKVLVGGQGGSGNQGGGGGGSFVTTSANAPLCIAGGGGGGIWSAGYDYGTSAGTTSNTGQTAYCGGCGGTVAGTGGSAGNGGGACQSQGSSASGGGGLTGSGSACSPTCGGSSFASGGAGGCSCGPSGAGGFGGGGGAEWCSWTGGGGGGGYSGGGGGSWYANGGGGGSYNGGTNQSNSSGVRAGNGQVIISWNVVGCPSATRVPVTVTVNPCAYAPGSQTFSYTGGVQTYTVPCNVTSVTIQTWGAQGGNAQYAGGLGGYASGNLSVSANSTFSVYVGGQGSGATGGYNGGGTSGGCGAGGGGASDVRNSGGTKLIIAPGGGGGGCDMYGYTGSAGGIGGGANGGTSGSSNGGYSSGGGGSQASGGISDGCCSVGTAGSWGQGGSGAGLGCGYYPGNGGGGGGGYYGGGGGGNCGGNTGGGGGSSYTGGVTGGSTTGGQRSGNGQVTISW
jgi:hypothetical protein